LLEARREAAVLLLLERDEFGLELHQRDDALAEMRDTNRMLLAQLTNATEALQESQLRLLRSGTAASGAQLQQGLARSCNRSWFFGIPKKFFFGLFP
jgi:hypothetical protein